MPSSLAVVTLAFDPIVRVGDYAVRLETLALAGVILLMLIVAARVARRVAAHPSLDDHLAEAEAPPREEHLRRDDLLFVVLGILPGAVIGGRLGSVLLHLDYYLAQPGAILDPSTGSLQLSFAIVGGLASGAVIGALLDTPVGRWLHVATFPLLLGLVLGKAAGILGGSGQGLPSDLPWAVAYSGDGPWAAWARRPLASGPAVRGDRLAGRADHRPGAATGWAFRARDGRAFFVALGLWAVGRFGTAFTWRDAPVLGPLRADQLLSLVVVAIAVAGFVLAPSARARGPRRRSERRPPEGTPAWPDPVTRPPF